MDLQFTKEKIGEKLVILIQEIIEDKSVTIDQSSSLIDDYGLDSIDLLDLTFNIEQIFAVKIGNDAIRGDIEGHLSTNDVIDRTGVLSVNAIEIIKDNNPEIPSDTVFEGFAPEDIPRLLNIKLLSRIILDKMTADQPV